MADRRVDHLLIGGGLAAANCARWLREEGADGSILLVGREPDPPYNRPPCSKEFLQGKEGREDELAGKRPRSSMTPVIVFKDGKPCMTLGSPGRLLVPAGILSVYNQLSGRQPLPEALRGMVAALVPMVPEGLVLMTRDPLVRQYPVSTMPA